MIPRTETRARILATMGDGREWSALMISKHLGHDRNACYDMLEKLVKKELAHVSGLRPTGKGIPTKFYRIGAMPEVTPAIIVQGKPMEPFEWLCSTLLSSSGVL